MNVDTKCNVCTRLLSPADVGDCCNGCRRAERNLFHGAKAHKYRAPFKAGTPEYLNWYRSVQSECARQGAHWPTFFAQAKAKAKVNPPQPTERTRHRALFGGAHTPEYRAWYNRTVAACKEAQSYGIDIAWPEFFNMAKESARNRAPSVSPLASLPPPEYNLHGKLFGGAHTKEYQEWYRKLKHRAFFQNIAGKGWDSFFQQAKWDEMEKQGLLPPKLPTRIVPRDDERLLFDFSVAPPHHLVTDSP